MSDYFEKTKYGLNFYHPVNKKDDGITAECFVSTIDFYHIALVTRVSGNQLVLNKEQATALIEDLKSYVEGN